MIQKIDKYPDIIGDDLGYNSPRYSQVPSGYGFESIQKHDDCPLTNAKWDTFVDFAKRYYRHFEIVGRTWKDFADNLQLSYDIGADTLERQLEVYQDDIAKPLLGRTEKVTYDLANDSENTGTDSETVKVESTASDDTTTTNNLQTQTETEGQTDNIDVPVDASNPNSQIPSNVTKNTGTDTTNNTGTVKLESTSNGSEDTTRNLNRSDRGKNTQTGTVTTELSDLGTRPNYESLNGFIDNNRTDLAVFVWLFRDCFTFGDVLTW